MKTALYIFAAVLLLPMLLKGSAGASSPVQPSVKPQEPVTPVQTDLVAPGNAQIFMDESGDLVTINSTGGTTVLPDPHGIGGGFAT